MVRMPLHLVVRAVALVKSRIKGQIAEGQVDMVALVYQITNGIMIAVLVPMRTETGVVVVVGTTAESVIEAIVVAAVEKMEVVLEMTLRA
jgi:hypothetical protein